jgi:hypothetical protein
MGAPTTRCDRVVVARRLVRLRGAWRRSRG